MEKLEDKLLPSVIDILLEKEPDHQGTIGQLFEWLEKETHWEHLPYYVLETLMEHVYGEDNIDVTESKVEILFKDY